MEFLSLLCHLLIIGLSATLPLYTGGTYWKLGDTKYALFRNLALFSLVIWLVAGACEKIRRRMLCGRGTGGDSLEGDRQKSGGLESGWQNRNRRAFSAGVRNRLSAVDAWMLCYGAAVISSAFFSRYRETAWLGYQEWYMGALSQLLFVGIYFFVSRRYDGRKYSLLLGGAAVFVVFLLGFCHRLGADPSGLMAGFDMLDWEYSHMLSTIGNINWFCGYCSVALVFPVAAVMGFFKASHRGALLPRRQAHTPADPQGESRRIAKRSFLEACAAYAVSVMGLTLLMIQGSDTGILLAALCLFVCGVCGIGDGRIFKGTVALGTGVCFLLSVYGLLVRLIGESAWAAIPVDGFCRNLAAWEGWWLLGAAGAALYIVTGRLLGAEGKARLLRRIALGTAGAFVLAGVSAVLIFSLKGSFEGGWGNGRGALWSLAVQGFWQNDLPGKLFGAGPDCFAEYMYSAFEQGTMPALGGRWAGTVFANAHNEWLNHLVNLGLVGTGCYLGIFISALRRYRGYLPGLLALIMYLAVSLTGFQQVLSTPLLFMTLGIAERESQTGKN